MRLTLLRIVPLARLQTSVIAFHLTHLVELAHIVGDELFVLSSLLLQVFAVELLADVHRVMSCRPLWLSISQSVALELV